MQDCQYNPRAAPWYECGKDLGAAKAAMMFDASSNAYFNNFEGASAESGNMAVV